MKKILNPVKILITYFGRKALPENAILIDSRPIRNDAGLKTYIVGRTRKSFKFVYCDGTTHKTKYVNRLVSGRTPQDELQMGIHDMMLSKFTNSNVQFFK